MMTGSTRIDGGILSLLRSRSGKKRTIVVGLKSDNYSREMLLRLLTLFVKPGDNVLAVHVQEPNDTFDPNTFHIHEDLCKAKQVDFQVKLCVGDSYISELAHQVRLNYATILALGCSLPRPNDSVVTSGLERLPPTCTLLVIDIGGRMLIQRQGTSQQGSTSVAPQSSLSSSSKYSCFNKSRTIPSPLTTSSSRQVGNIGIRSATKAVHVPEFMAPKLLPRLVPEPKGSIRRFTPQELVSATNNFSPAMVIGEGGHSKVYRGILEDGSAVAVKFLKTTPWSEEDLLQETQMLITVNHENIVQIIGYCCSKEMQAVVYNLLRGSLKQKLRRLRWSERMGVAIGVAKALEYLHHVCNPPIIHRDVKSSNILLSDKCQPQLSDFGAAMLNNQSQQVSSNKRPLKVVGTFGYLAPEYMMYGRVDEKVDVYSYGVVLLELITGKEAIQTNQANHESLVLWARSLLGCGLCERLIDPNLNNDYKEKEMEIMMIAARLCLIHLSSKRPTMKVILRLFEEPEYWIKLQSQKDDFENGISSKGDTGLWRDDDSATYETPIMDDI